MKRYLILILIGIAILLAVLAFVMNKDRNTSMNSDPLAGSALPTEAVDNPTPTNAPEPVPANWETYTSSEYGFLIKHPKDVKQETTSEGEQFSKMGPTQTTGTELFDGISVVITSGNLGEDDFEEFVSKKYDEIKNDPIQPQVGERMSVTIAGKSGYALRVKSIGDSTRIYLPKGDSEYLEIINSTVEPTNREQTFQKTVDTMLSSLIYE